MKTWVKLYTEINRDPKMGTLSWAHRGIWSALLALAGEMDHRDENDAETGELDTLDNAAWCIRCELGEFRAAVQEFIKRGMIGEQDGVLYVVQWAKYRPTEVSRPEHAVSEWRKAVFARDDFTCQECGARGVKLRAHHIRPWCGFPQLRFDPENGVTLCVDCHRARHGRGWKKAALNGK